MTNEANIDLRTREGKALKLAQAEENAPISSKSAVGKESSEQSRARAEARIREIRGNPDLANGTERDKYWAPPPPDGFDYQWKLKSVLNQDDIDRIRQNEMNGWEPVPLSRHPELMPRGWKGDTIEVGGLVLMERPMMFTQEAREEERRLAKEAVYTKESQMREGRAGDLGPRNVNRFSKSHSRIDVPSE
jgi:hypothetical protein